MESSLFQLSRELNQQTKLNVSNVSVNLCPSKPRYSYTIEDDEILDQKFMELSEDPETWLYVADENRGKALSGNAMEWLQNPLKSQFTLNSQISIGCGITSNNFANVTSEHIIEQSRRSYDSRTYTRPKKRQFRQSLIQEVVAGGCGANGNGSYILTASTPTTTSSTNSPCNTTFTMSPSIGIIDIDELTDSQLGFNMVGQRTPATAVAQSSPRNHTFERNNSSTPCTVSDRRNWKFGLDPSFESSTPVPEPEPPSSAILSEYNKKNWKYGLGSGFGIGGITPANHRSSVAVNHSVKPPEHSSLSSNHVNNYKVSTDSSVKLNATDLLSISFPRNLLNSTTMLVSSESIDTTQIENNVCNNELSIKNHTNNNVANGTGSDINESVVDNDKIIENGTDTPAVDTDTPPPKHAFLGNPLSISTPTHRSSESFQKSSLKMRKMSRLPENGRFSDSSTDTDAPSISTEDLSEEQVSPVLNDISSDIGGGGIGGDSSRETGSPMISCGGDSLKALNTTIDLSSPNVKKTSSSGTAILNSTFRKSPINTTFCKSAEALNGAERCDSGPEDDVMSTASDSSFSSSCMRSVGEIQSIARLQEESLRQQTDSPNRSIAWGGSNGGGEVVENKLRNNRVNRPDRSDRSLDRYKTVTLNNNNIRNAATRPALRPPSSYGTTTRMQQARSVEQLAVTGRQNSDIQPTMRMSGLRPPSSVNRFTQQPSSAPASRLQPPGVRPSGLRPPSVIPRPVSRLPAPTVSSALPKYNQRGGRQ